MRVVLLLCALTACTAEGPNRGYLGESSGSLQIDGKERDFDGGALEVRSTDGDTLIVLTTNGWHFTCDWVEGSFSSRGGKNVDRQGTHWDLVWIESEPDQAVLYGSRQGLFGGGTGSAKGLEAEMVFEDEGVGTLATNRGEVWFEAHLCPGKIDF